MKDNSETIVITVAGNHGSCDRITILREIHRALEQAHIRSGVKVVSSYSVPVPDSEQGKNLDVLAKKCKTGQLMIEIKDIAVYSRHEDDVPF